MGGGGEGKQLRGVMLGGTWSMDIRRGAVAKFLPAKKRRKNEQFIFKPGKAGTIFKILEHEIENKKPSIHPPPLGIQ